MRRAFALIAALAAADAQAGDALETRALAELERQGLGADALLLIDNLLRHGAPPPPAAAPLVRELLARPLDAANAGNWFRRAVPPALAAFGAPTPGPQIGEFETRIAAYLASLAEAGQRLLAATSNLDIAIPDARPSAAQLLAVAHSVDVTGVERANALFFEATARFIGTLTHTAVGEPRTFDSAIGTVRIGTTGNDRYAPGAALIVDPGGDDVYERVPGRGGAVIVIVDFSGNDRYVGADVALGALSAIVDMAGDDRYEAQGPGLGAAIAGASLLVDQDGNDVYDTQLFGQGAAAFGVGALIDQAGNDLYRLHAWGQGFGMAGGLGLLWDRGGDDRYAAAGVPDFFQRGGGLSGAQGAAFGFRTSLGGGVGILRDERGDDDYAAEMFGQGSAFYYGAGLLWDGGGDDRYRAVRYAQGNGAHEAVGALRDEAGNDRYELALGAGQGMGLDLAVGALVDGGGDDSYRARFFAQGSATANGLGLLADGAGEDQLHVEHAGSWGAAEPMRGLPSVGLFLHHSRSPRPGGLAAAGESDSCTKDENLRERIAALRPERFTELLAVGSALRCALKDGEMWEEAERLLAEDPASALAGWIAGTLARAPPSSQTKILIRLQAHPRCGVHALALESVPRAAAARTALGSSCWQLQAAALGALAKLGEAPGPEVSLPSFLRGRRAY